MNYPPGYDRPLVRTLNRVALGTIIVCACLAVMALVYPARWAIGPLEFSLRRTRNPGIALLAALIVFQLTSPVYGPQFRARASALWLRFKRLWNEWSYGRRILCVFVLGQTYFLGSEWLEYSRRLADHRDWIRRLFEHAVFTHDHPFLEHFARQVSEKTPPDARILYHGYIDGMVFAAEVYPRRVFMLPGEMYGIASSWHKQRWLKAIPDDPREPYWRRHFPKQTIDRETFIRQHGITHEVTFVEDHYSLCKIEELKR